MPPSAAWRRYLRFWRTDLGADIDDELRFHIEEGVDELIARGHRPAEARARVLASFGDVAAVRTELTTIDHRSFEQARRGEAWKRITRDLRRAVRRLCREPAFAIPAALTIGVGIGATVGVFSLANAI